MINALLLIDIVGIVVGIIAVAAIVRKRATLGGRVGQALNLFVFGVAFMVLAFTWTLVFSRLALLPPPPLNAHNLLMMIGMIFFVFSTRKFTSLLEGNKQE